MAPKKKAEPTVKPAPETVTPAPETAPVAPASQEPYGEDISIGTLGGMPPAGDGATGEVTDEASTDGAGEDPTGEPATDPAARLTSRAAPLEAPAPPKVEDGSAGEDDDAPQPAGNLGAAMVRNSRPGAKLVDQRTGEAPDPETLFEQFGPGVAVRCTVRLCQDTYIGAHGNPIRQLVMPQGQVTGPEKAAQILAVLRAQIERDAPAETDSQE